MENQGRHEESGGWLTPGKLYPANSDGLREELKDLTTFLSLSEEEVEVRKVKIRDIRRAIKQIFGPTVRSIELIGSTFTRTNLETSDLDFCVVLWSDRTPQECKRECHRLMRGLVRRGYIRMKDIELVHQHIPIVTFRLEDIQIKVDISFNNLQSIEIARFMRQQYSSIDNFKNLHVLVKNMLWRQNPPLNKIKKNGFQNNGLTSFPLALLILVYLQESKLPPQPLEKALLGFLHFAAKEFKYSDCEIFFREQYGVWFDLFPALMEVTGENPNDFYFVNTEDGSSQLDNLPAGFENRRKWYKIDKVKQYFLKTHESLEQMIQGNPNKTVNSFLAPTIIPERNPVYKNDL